MVHIMSQGYMRHGYGVTHAMLAELSDVAQG